MRFAGTICGWNAKTSRLFGIDEHLHPVHVVVAVGLVVAERLERA